MPFDQTDHLLNRSPDKFGNPDLVTTPAARYLSEGEVIAGRYRITSAIGQGAMGSVYAVDQIFLLKRFALKTLNPIAATDVVLRRFQNEAQTTSRLDHPNIVRSIDFGLIDNSQPFLVMDFVEGQTLSRVLKEKGKLSKEMVLEIFIPICLAIGYAHQEGVVHRDIKPGNILLAKSDSIATDFTPKIVDFGIAKIAGADETLALTRTGEVFGTPLYMSPEQCSGTKVDKRSDIYSLGCVMFESLTGSAPFVGQTALETMMQHTTSELPSMKQASLGGEFPPVLENIIAKMLTKDPKDRYQSCLEVAEDLIRYQRDPLAVSVSKNVVAKPKSKLSTVAWVVLAVCAIGCGALGYGWYQWQWHKPDAKKDADSANKKQDPQSKRIDSIVPSKVQDFDPVDDVYSTIDIDGSRINFDFPPEDDLGKIVYWDSPSHYVIKDATKAVSFPEKTKRIFVLNETLISHPHYAQYFRPDDFAGLVINDQYHLFDLESFNKACEPLTRLSGLRALVFEYCDISDESYSHINSLPNLCWLTTRKSLDVARVANLKRLRELRVLSFDGGERSKNISSVLKKLAGSKSIKRLSLDHSDISSGDFGLIAKWRSLTHLNLVHTFESGGQKLNDQERQQCMTQLASLPHLRCLALPFSLIFESPGKLSLKALRHLSEMKQLDVLYLEATLPAQDLQKLKSYLSPKCRFAEWKDEKVKEPDTWFDPTLTNPDTDDLW